MTVHFCIKKRGKVSKVEKIQYRNQKSGGALDVARHDVTDDGGGSGGSDLLFKRM